jgi:hypothetical protein
MERATTSRMSAEGMIRMIAYTRTVPTALVTAVRKLIVPSSARRRRPHKIHAVCHPGNFANADTALRCRSSGREGRLPGIARSRPRRAPAVR